MIPWLRIPWISLGSELAITRTFFPTASSTSQTNLHSETIVRCSAPRFTLSSRRVRLIVGLPRFSDISLSCTCFASTTTPTRRSSAATAASSMFGLIAGHVDTSIAFSAAAASTCETVAGLRCARSGPLQPLLDFANLHPEPLHCAFPLPALRSSNVVQAAGCTGLDTDADAADHTDAADADIAAAGCPQTPQGSLQLSGGSVGVEAWLSAAAAAPVGEAVAEVVKEEDKANEEEVVVAWACWPGRLRLSGWAGGMGSLRSLSVVREASHAGTWYTADAEELQQELDEWLAAAEKVLEPSRVIIAPHAGYRYSGRCAGHAYTHLDTETTKRVFLLGPSHHHYTRKCCLSLMRTYETPLGQTPIDTAVYEELKASGKFDSMSKDVDEAEHSLEMHLPYIQRVYSGKPFTLVPIMVGALTPENEAAYGKLLAPYVDDPNNAFVVSSDFCHWGMRFNYTHYDKKCGPIYKSIEALDRQGMDLIEGGNPAAFTEYLRVYENTICGRHPIGVLLQMLKHCQTPLALKFVQYEQSSQCRANHDSSVSYASAVAKPAA